MKLPLEWLKEYVYSEMITAKRERVCGKVLKISFRSCPDSVVIKDVCSLPEAFVEIERKPKKADILAWFKKEGEVPPGSDIITGKKTLSIR